MHNADVYVACDKYGHVKVHEEIKDQEHPVSKQRSKSYDSPRRVTPVEKGIESVVG